MAESNRKLAAAVRAYQRAIEAETRLARERERLYAAVVDAIEAGVTISALARAFGLTRQAVQHLARRGRE